MSITDSEVDLIYYEKSLTKKLIIRWLVEIFLSYLIFGQLLYFYHLLTGYVLYAGDSFEIILVRFTILLVLLLFLKEFIPSKNDIISTDAKKGIAEAKLYLLRKNRAKNVREEKILNEIASLEKTSN